MALDPNTAPKTLAQLQEYVVNRPGWELLTWDFYDRAAYAAAGQTQLTFFALPIGQGGKTSDDTNMDLAGQLPTNQIFMVTAIEVAFFPTTPTVVAQMPAAFGAQAVAEIVNDAYIFSRSGNLNFFIGSKTYLQVAPLMKFPSSSNFHVEAAAADQSTIAASLQTRIAFGHSVGQPYRLLTPITLIENQNFRVTLNWAAAQAVTNPASVYVTLKGHLARRSQ